MQSASVGKKGAYGLHYEQTSCSLTKTMNCEWCKCTLILVQWKCFKKKVCKLFITCNNSLSHGRVIQYVRDKNP